MKIVLESKEFELQANGLFLKRYGELFKGNALADFGNAVQQREPLSIARLTFAAITPTPAISFDEWLASFKNPFFIVEKADDILLFFMEQMTPTVEKEESGKQSEKKQKKKDH